MSNWRNEPAFEFFAHWTQPSLSRCLFDGSFTSEVSPADEEEVQLDHVNNT